MASNSQPTMVLLCNSDGSQNFQINTASAQNMSVHNIAIPLKDSACSQNPYFSLCSQGGTRGALPNGLSASFGSTMIPTPGFNLSSGHFSFPSALNFAVVPNTPMQQCPPTLPLPQFVPSSMEPNLCSSSSPSSSSRASRRFRRSGRDRSLSASRSYSRSRSRSRGRGNRHVLPPPKPQTQYFTRGTGDFTCSSRNEVEPDVTMKTIVPPDMKTEVIRSEPHSVQLSSNKKRDRKNLTSKERDDKRKLNKRIRERERRKQIKENQMRLQRENAMMKELLREKYGFTDTKFSALFGYVGEDVVAA